jgi:hypothetical protein
MELRAGSRQSIRRNSASTRPLLDANLIPCSSKITFNPQTVSIDVQRTGGGASWVRIALTAAFV